MNKLKEVLARHTVDELKSLMRCLPDASPTGKKDDLVSKIHRSLAGAGLHALWNRLDDTQRLAVAETLYAVDGSFIQIGSAQNTDSYLTSPSAKEPGSRYSYYRQPTPLALLLYYQEGYYGVPADLCEQLRPLCRNLHPCSFTPARRCRKWW
jgi:hypothetical protein